MNNILNFVTVIFTLSFFQMANATQLPIEKIDYQKGSWLIEVSGFIPNPCVTSPKPILLQSPKGPNLFLFQIVGQTKNRICPQVVGGPYTMSVDMRALLRESRFDLRPGVTYVIKTENYPFEMEFEGEPSLLSSEARDIFFNGRNMNGL